MPPAPMALTTLGDAVDLLLQRCGPHVILAAPLGLGKPHRLLNAIYQRFAGEPALSLKILTALSLTPPTPKSDVEKRFLQPFLDRHFGPDFPSLDYSLAQRRDTLPSNIVVEEFYLQSGALLGSRQAQSHYVCLNYTHVARAVAERGTNAMVQKVVREPGGTRLSLSCNPDLTFDLLDEIARAGKPRPLLIAEIDPNLPWLDGPCVVEADFFDAVIDVPGPTPKLFALPREPVSDADYAIGLYASTLVRDGGTLQIGIGSLSDALCHALVLRHTRNAEYRLLLEALAPGHAQSGLVRQFGGVEPLAQGLYGASEMVNDGFRRLREAGILVRRVVDDVDTMHRLNCGKATADDLARIEKEGRWLDGGFYLGSSELYRWLRDMPAADKAGIGMTRISHINELYGGNESLEREQRRDARFFNTCMMMTALGAATSDALADGRVVSGVGGQYNFVAMAHAIHGGRSVLMLRAARGGEDNAQSNILWNYGHTTIPRHLRDIAITEYGVADLRGASDGECVARMLAICDGRFRAKLLESAKRAMKIAGDAALPTTDTSCTPAQLRAMLRPYRQMGLLPDFPLGSDFTPVEERLVRALGWLKSATSTRIGKARTIGAALVSRGGSDRDAIERMGLAKPVGLGEKLLQRLVSLGLSKTLP